MKVLALYSIKGGVGKTSSAVNLAFIAAQQGFRTLLWDLDSQGASSFYFRIKPKIKSSSKELIVGKRELDELIKRTDFDNLDLLPSDFSCRNIDLVLDNKKKPTQQLKKQLKLLVDDYDFVILDCPPTLSLLSEAIFVAADAVITPIVPSTLSLRTLEQLKKFVKDNELKKLLLMPFFAMVDRRKNLHKTTIENSKANSVDFLHAMIPYASDIERMGVERKPLPAYVKKSLATTAYYLLWQEILEHLQKDTAIFKY